MSSLPPEILDLVFDHVSYNEDVKTLCSWSLLCRSWTAPSQRAIFRQVEITHFSHCLQLLFCLHHSTHLQEYVLVLILNRVVLPDYMLDDLPLCAPNVHRVEFIGMPPLFKLLSKMKKMTSLTIDACIEGRFDPGRSMPAAPVMIPLREFNIVNVEYAQSHYANWFTSTWVLLWIEQYTTAKTTLRSTTQIIHRGSDLHNTARFIAEYSQLEHLTLMIGYNSFEGPSKPYLDQYVGVYLNHICVGLGAVNITSLSVVSLIDCFIQSQSTAPITLPVFQMLRIISFPRLRKLHMRFRPQESPNSRPEFFPFGNSAVNNPIISSSEDFDVLPMELTSQLASMTIEFDGFWTVHDFPDLIKTFGDIAARGVLDVRAGYADLLGKR